MSDFVELTQELINDPDKTINFFNTSEVKRKNKLLQQYFSLLFKGQIPIEKGLQFFRQLTVTEASFQLLLDQLYLLSQSLPNLATNPEGPRKLYKQLLQSLYDRLPTAQRHQLFDYLDEETLAEASLINQASFNRRRTQLNTQLNFMQSKYGMMRDENEGYSKLIVEVLQCTNDESSETCIHNLFSLIGYFDLDPDRVVDLVLECWVQAPLNLSYLAILRQFKQASLAHFLGKRFEHLLSSTGNAAHHFGSQPTQLENAYQSLLTDPRVPPQNLVRTAALCIKYGLFDISHIWKYLSPLDVDMEKTFADKCDSAFRFYKSFDQLKAVEELNDQDNKGERLKKEVYEQYLYNHKLWLLQGLLSVNCFDVFKRLFYAIGGNIDLTNFHPLKRSIADFVDWVIEPLYKNLCYSHLFKNRSIKSENLKVLFDPKAQCRQVPQFFLINGQFFDLLEELLQMFQPYISEFPLTFHKLVRILTSSTSNEYADRIESIIMRVLLPSMAARDNLPVVKVLWKYASQLDYRKRYLYYSEWKDDQQFKSLHQVLRGAELAKCFLRQVFNKLDKDNKEKMMMRLAKISHSQPILAMNELRRDRVQNSDNNPFMINALGLMTGLSLDILTYSIVQWLNDFNDETKIRPRDIECSPWFKNMGLFLSAFYRKYYHVEMQGLFVYICEGLIHKQVIKPELFILKELIEKMTGIVQIEDLNQDQVQALAGGRYIQLETTHQTNDYKKSRKSNYALENFFWNTTIASQQLINQDGQEEQVSLAFLLFVILCQQRTIFLKAYNDQNLRPLSVVFDNFTWSINQLTKCLLFQTDKPTHYAQLFPKNPLYRLVIDFKIQFEIAIRIVRYGHKSLYNMSDEEFQDVRTNIKEIFDKVDVQHMYDNPDYGVHDVLQLPTLAHTLVKDQVWEYVNPDLFAIFWLLSVDNIYVPVVTYEKMLKQIQDNISKITDPKELVRQQKSGAKALEKMQSELENNKKRKEQFEKFLVDKKDYFRFKEDEYEQFTSILCQICILPRVLIDPAEAMFCAKFVHTLIRIAHCKYTYNFYIPREIIQYTLSYLQCATEQESVNLSVFIMLLIQPFANWNDEPKYKADLRSYFEVQEEHIKPYDKERNFIVGTIFLRILQFIRLLKNSETQVRNAMIFLKTTFDIFPPTQQIAHMLKEYLAEVSELYKDVQDIRVRIQTYKLNEKLSTLPNYQSTYIQNPPIPREQRSEREQRDLARDGGRDRDREIRDRETRDRETRERETRERETRERETRERETRERETRERDRERETRETRERDRERETRDPEREPRHNRETRGPLDTRESRDTRGEYRNQHRDQKDYRHDKDQNDKRKDNGKKLVDKPHEMMRKDDRKDDKDKDPQQFTGGLRKGPRK